MALNISQLSTNYQLDDNGLFNCLALILISGKVLAKLTSSNDVSVSVQKFREKKLFIFAKGSIFWEMASDIFVYFCLRGYFKNIVTSMIITTTMRFKLMLKIAFCCSKKLSSQFYKYYLNVFDEKP